MGGSRGWAAASILLAACGGSELGGVPSDGGADALDAGAAAPDAGPSDAPPSDGALPRPYALASTGLQLVTSGPAIGVQLTPANLADDVDVAGVRQEVYGVPWAELMAGAPPPDAWVEQMDRVANDAKKAKLDVFLSISPLSSSRDKLAARTVVDASGQVKIDDAWSAPCYDFATAPDRAAVKSAYLAYVGWMIDRFAPTYLNVGIELNVFFEKCPAARAGLVEVIDAAYDAAKAKRPSLVTFVSIQLEHLYGYADGSCSDPKDAQKRAACYDAHYADLAGIKRDRFAMATYPYTSFDRPSAIPADWFAKAAARGGEKPLVAETGWLSSSIRARTSAGQCLDVLAETPDAENAYLGRVLADAEALPMELVGWWSNRDLIDARVMTDCPCAFDPTWCAIVNAFRGPPPPDGGPDTQLYGELGLKVFGTTGIRDFGGAPKLPVYATWKAAQARPR